MADIRATPEFLLSAEENTKEKTDRSAEEGKRDVHRQHIRCSIPGVILNISSVEQCLYHSGTSDHPPSRQRARKRNADPPLTEEALKESFNSLENFFQSARETRSSHHVGSRPPAVLR